MAAPIAVLAVGVVAIVPRGERLRVALTWAGALLVLGGLWYVRNLVAFGNPVPAAGLELGPISLPSPPLTELTYAPVHYFAQDGVWRETFLPGLRDAFGPAWWVLLGLAAAGMVAAALGTRGRVVRVLGLVAIVSGVAVIFTPQGLGTEDDPLFFKFNLRYPTPALMLGLVLLPLAPRLEKGRARVLLPARLLAVLAVTQLDPAIWPTELRDGRFAEPPSGGTALGGVAIGAAVLLLALLATAPRARAGLSGRRPVAALAVASGAGGRGGRLRAPAPLPGPALHGLPAHAGRGRLGTRRGGRPDRDRGLLHPVPALRTRPVEPGGLRGASRTARRVHPHRELSRLEAGAQRGRLRLRGHHPVQLSGQPARRPARRGRLDGI